MRTPFRLRSPWRALAAAVWLAGCAPLTQTAEAPPPTFSGPRLEADALVSFDGARLPLTVWSAEHEGRPVEPWAVIVALHGMNDYANTYAMAGPYWARRGITTYAYDQRGFGRSSRRGIWPGETLLERDLQSAVRLLRARHPDAVLAVVGESMGAATAVSAFASDTELQPDRIVLLSPAVWGWEVQPVRNRMALWLAAHLLPQHRIRTPGRFTRNLRTSDNRPMLEARVRDPHMLVSTRVDALYGVTNLMQSARRRIGGVKPPVLFLYGARDQLIPQHAAASAAARLKRRDQTAYYADGWHLLTRDLQAPTVWKDVEAFIRDPWEPLPSGAPPLLDAPKLRTASASSERRTPALTRPGIDHAGRQTRTCSPGLRADSAARLPCNGAQARLERTP